MLLQCWRGDPGEFRQVFCFLVQYVFFYIREELLLRDALYAAEIEKFRLGVKSLVVAVLVVPLPQRST